MIEFTWKGGDEYDIIPVDADDQYADDEKLAFKSGDYVELYTTFVNEPTRQKLGGIQINEFQASLLNGTLDNVLGTSVPFEVGDIIRCRFTINGNLTSTNPVNTIFSKPSLNYDYSIFIDFVVVASN